MTQLYALYLNPMRDKYEVRHLIALSEYPEKLQNLLDENRVEPYDDIGINIYFDGPYTYHKYFKKNGPLEWYNPPTMDDRFGIIKLITKYELIDNYCEWYDREFTHSPKRIF